MNHALGAVPYVQVSRFGRLLALSMLLFGGISCEYFDPNAATDASYPAVDGFWDFGRIPETTTCPAQAEVGVKTGSIRVLQSVEQIRFEGPGGAVWEGRLDIVGSFSLTRDQVETGSREFDDFHVVSRMNGNFRESNFGWDRFTAVENVTVTFFNVLGQQSLVCTIHYAWTGEK